MPKGTASLNRRMTLNRHDHPAPALGTRVAKDTMVQSHHRETQERAYEALRNVVRFLPGSHFGLAFLSRLRRDWRLVISE